MNIPSEVIELSIKTYRNQSIFPMSPGKFAKDGSPQFCAAAVLAYSGLLINFGRKSADEFAIKTCESNNSDHIFTVFSTLGWNYEIGLDALGENDASTSCSRKNNVMKFLSSLKSGSTIIQNSIE